MSEMRKINDIFIENQSLSKLIRQADLHLEIHNLISKSFSQVIEFNVLLKYGTLHITVPNVNHWHLVHFSQKNLLVLLRKEGLAVDKIEVKKSTP